MSETIKVGGTMMWASLAKPNDMSGKYQFDLCNLSAAACTALEKMGLNVRNDDDKPEKGAYLTLKSNYPIFAFAPDGSKIEDKVGNGSKAQVVIGYYDWQFKNKKGRSPSPSKVVITELQVYNSSPAGEEEEESDMVL